MHGIIVIDKPSGPSSNDVVVSVKKILALKKAGHLGTLDPLATGVLPLGINEGTKLAPFLLASEKEYIATLRLGIETDTQDSQGQILHQSLQIPQEQDRIRSVLQEFQGEILQTPPMFSALKYKGVPLYTIARKGGWIPRKPRKITIKAIEILRLAIPFIMFRVVCSHGTYIRTLCSDIGKRLSCGAHLLELKRIRNGSFHIKDALRIEALKVQAQNGSIARHIVSPNHALAGLPTIVVDHKLIKKVQNGVQVTGQDLQTMKLPTIKVGQKVKLVAPNGNLVGVVESCINKHTYTTQSLQLKAWKILRVFLN